jgi:DNA-directed RNA polymerase specialized sigma24 family protein
MATTTPADLAELLARVALRDQQAFDQLYRATSAHLLGVAFGVMQQRERAEDVLQEAYINVWHSAGSFRVQQASAMTWLINIVRNKAIDRIRSVQRRIRLRFGDTHFGEALLLDRRGAGLAARPCAGRHRHAAPRADGPVDRPHRRP